jgi:hypothetical protein
MITEHGELFMKYRPVFAALVAILFYAITDILIWQRIFEANEMVKYADLYHTGWFVTLAGYAFLGIMLLWGSWKDCLYFVTALLIGAFSGLEDILYYILDRKPMPASLPWLSGNPMIYGSSRLEVIGSALFWMAVLITLYVVLYIWQKDRPQKKFTQL